MEVREASAKYLPSEADGCPVGYKQTEVGVIPEDWSVVSIAEIAEVKTGPFGSALHESDYVEVGTPIITVEHLGEHGVVHQNLPMVSDADKKRLHVYGLRQGDIVFSRVGSIDRNSLIGKEEDGWLFSGRLLRVRTEVGRVDSRYLSRHFHSEAFKQRVRSVAVGQTMASLNTKILCGVKAVLPPVSEQQAIASALSDADALIESLSQLLAKKRQIKQGAMQELLTGKRRLPGFSGEWRVKRLGEVGSFYKGRGLPKSALSPFGSEKCIHYGELFTKYPAAIKAIESYTDQIDGAFVSQANDVLMPTSDVTPSGLAKASAVMESGVILGGDILVIRVDKTSLFGPFLSHVIRLEESQILRLVTGTTVFHLYAADMKKFEFRMPSISEQQAIIIVLDDMETEISELVGKLAKARKLKQGMMQELLTGRIRLV